MISDKVVTVVPSTIKDALYLSGKLREQDVLEIEANNSTPVESLTYAIRASSAQNFSLIYSGEPVLMGGTVAESIGIARLWMLASDKAYTKPLILGMLSRKWVNLLHQPYEILYNYVWKSNNKAIRLLEFLNCSIENEVIIKKNLNFVKFIRCKPEEKRI